MTINSKYRDQVALLLEVIEPALNDNRLTLKGGTAINLFMMNMPRFSVDLDLTYQPVTNRTDFIHEISDVFLKMEKRLSKYHVQTIRTSEKIPKQIRVFKGEINIKIEINHLLRGSVYQPKILELCQNAQIEFEKSVRILCASFDDLYSGKFCAALDRQHPRDLFDVKLFFENFVFTEKIKKAFFVYLISGNRPISEMLSPNLINQKSLFTDQFEGMLENTVTYEELEISRERLIETIRRNLNDDDRMFLISFKKGKPQWELLDLPHVQHLPSIKWKLMNIQRMTLERQLQALKNLEKTLT